MIKLGERRKNKILRRIRELVISIDRSIDRSIDDDDFFDARIILYCISGDDAIMMGNL
jgi:hypothetical protein